MATVVNTTFRFKRGPAINWTTKNILLQPGEPGFEIDTGKLKIGDGVTRWNDLPYLGESDHGIINAATHYDFPSVGSAEMIYKAEKERKIYQWEASTSTYVEISANGEFIGEDITIINGGKANGYT